jgi:hypothetical protein
MRKKLARTTQCAKCNWGGDYPADTVAGFFEDSNAEICKLFDYCQRTSGRNSVGFECHVTKNDALRWIESKRPHLLDNV